MGYVLEVIGFIIFILVFISNTHVDNSIHQVYLQLQYVTAAILIGSGRIIINIQSLKKEVKNGRQTINNS